MGKKKKSDVGAFIPEPPTRPTVAATTTAIEPTNTTTGEPQCVEDGATAILSAKVKALEERLSHVAMFDSALSLQPYIPGPPVPSVNHLYHRACSSDGITIDSWLPTWLKHCKHTIDTYDLKKQSAYSEFAKCAYKPCIIAGSGPSLRKNINVLREQRQDVMLVSCLHNFAYLEDNGISADYYLNLDSGDITLNEMAQGGEHNEKHYWNLAKDRTLITSITGHPEMHRKWQGKKRFYAVVASSAEYIAKYKEMTDFKLFFSVGGNALGACLYFAKAILGACPIAFVGADFSFGYDKQFHPFKSPYDINVGGIQWATDIYGNKVPTWPSYYNFKCWVDYIACGGQGTQPGFYVNCTEGGILGAYAEGNIMQIQQMKLAEFLFPYTLHKRLPDIMKGEGYQFLF